MVSRQVSWLAGLCFCPPSRDLAGLSDMNGQKTHRLQLRGQRQHCLNGALASLLAPGKTLPENLDGFDYGKLPRSSQESYKDMFIWTNKLSV